MFKSTVWHRQNNNLLSVVILSAAANSNNQLPKMFSCQLIACLQTFMKRANPLIVSVKEVIQEVGGARSIRRWFGASLSSRIT